MIGFCPLASGSKGNCIYLGTPGCKLLIDAGISGKMIKARLAEIDVDLSDINAILITHEHSDHIQGLRVLAYRMGIPVYANSETAKGIVDTFGKSPTFKIFSTGETFTIGDIDIHPFSIQHDAMDPVAYTIEWSGLKLGFCADLGFVTSLVRTKLRDCDYLYIEANHEPSMVHACGRPIVYKQRVLGRSGHLSNEACGDLLAEVGHEGLKHVHLAHLSDECNNPEVAVDKVKTLMRAAGFEPEISVAYQDRISRAVLLEKATSSAMV